MKEAIEEARKTMNLNYGGPFGAMITKDNKIIAIASNTVLKDNDPTAHAEINAIRKAGEVLNTHDLSGCTLYATGYPCPMCLSAIIWSNIKEVFYGTNLEDAANIGFRDELPENVLEAADVFRSAMDKYLEKNFTESRELFEKAASLVPGDESPLVYAHRCAEFIEKGIPENWNGVITLTTK